MTAHSNFHSASPRRERVTRRAFVVWMAAYAVIIIAIVAAHAFTGSPTTVDGKGMRSLQAKITGAPQSSIAAPAASNVVLIDDKG